MKVLTDWEEGYKDGVRVAIREVEAYNGYKQDGIITKDAIIKRLYEIIKVTASK